MALARLAKVIQMIPGRDCQSILVQLENYIAQQLDGGDYRGVMADVADHLDGCLACAESYARLYELALAEAVGRLPHPAHIPPPDLHFLPGLSQRLQQAVRQLGQTIQLQLSAELLSLLTPQPAALAFRAGEENLLWELEAQPALPLNLAVYRDLLRPELCQLEVTVQMAGREWPNLAGIRVEIESPAGIRQTITDSWGLATFTNLPLTALPQLTLSVQTERN